jgi:sugar-specific transcriptional regulator TrmB
LIDKAEIDKLVEVGFTYNQAKVYLNLLSTGKLNARKISKQSQLPRQEVYRILNELQEKGFIEKIVGMPFEFEAVPLQEMLQILVEQTTQKCNATEKKAKAFYVNYSSHFLLDRQESEYKISIVEGRHRILQKIKSQHYEAKKSIKVISTLQRLSQIFEFCGHYCEKARDRGVNYQVILEKSVFDSVCLPNILKAFFAGSNCELRLSPTPIRTNAAIIDGQEVTFSFYPLKNVNESPLIWTNHPTFISMCQDHFDCLWNASVPINKEAPPAKPSA